MSSATETLCGLAFGAGQYHMLGIYLQRSWIINLTAVTLLVPFFVFAGPIFRLLGQDDNIAKEIGNISLWFIPILYYFVFTLTIQKYFQGQLKNMIVGWLCNSCLPILALCDQMELGCPWCNECHDHIILVDGCRRVCIRFRSVRVANELGTGNSEAAGFSVKVISITSLCIGLFFAVLCLIFGHGMCYLFTSNEEVAKSVLLAFSILLNSLQPVFSGVAVGAGWQSVVAFINIGSYYIIGVPLGLLLGYVGHLQVMGIWTGMICGVAMQTLVLSYIIWKTNWDHHVNNTADHLNRWVLKPTEELNGRLGSSTHD
ncbi:protein DETOXIFICATION 24-like [Cornus florida]|uniref:protein DETOXIFICATION 24-like n=1 Tax=Cornus florida TaxID=4283 RepID=UPI00289DA3E3|nr:protein DETOXIFICATION 24-like [Cornus florida]